MTRWSAASVRGWTRTTRLTVRPAAKPSSLPAAWSYARRTWIAPNATSARATTASPSLSGTRRPASSQADQEYGAELGHEVAARQQDREPADRDDPQDGQPAAPPVEGPDRLEHEDPGEARQRHPDELDRDPGELAPGAR